MKHPPFTLMRTGSPGGLGWPHRHLRSSTTQVACCCSCRPAGACPHPTLPPPCAGARGCPPPPRELPAEVVAAADAPTEGTPRTAHLPDRPLSLRRGGRRSSGEPPSPVSSLATRVGEPGAGGRPPASGSPRQFAVSAVSPEPAPLLALRQE